MREACPPSSCKPPRMTRSPDARRVEGRLQETTQQLTSLMCIMTIAMVILFTLIPSGVVAQFYSWTDEKGETHFTNDLNLVPERYRQGMQAPPAGKGPAPGVTPPAGPPPTDPARETALRQAMQKATENLWELLLRSEEQGFIESTQLNLPLRPRLDPAMGKEATRECQDRFPPNQITVMSGLEPFGLCFVEKVMEKHLTRNPLCYEGARRVTGPPENAVQPVYKWLWQVASREIYGRTVSVFVIDSPERYNALAGVCSDFRRSNIVLWLKALTAFQSSPDPEALIAHTIGHELAHIVLHQQDEVRGKFFLDLRTREYEADELSVYYVGRAGYDCRRVVELVGLAFRPPYDTVANVRQALKVACDRAKSGTRPPRRAAARSELQPK